ncbi:hypothetical protein VE03_02652 [Pseudogymnoascus sp. 23342-1-I1]|nr:hypothetical protein VE03_02652 [Pseudogymnoascus sp. 23342-1-I1]
MIKSTQIARLDGLMLCASIDDEATENALTEIKSHVKMVLRRLGRNSEPQASIESGAYTLHYLIVNSIVYIAICERSYPRKLAFTYLSDISSEFSSTYTHTQLTAPSLRPYAFMEFDTFIQRTKATYSDTRATQNLDKLNSELQDVTKVMTKNIEDLLYRGDSLERMGEMSSRLRDDSKKYKRAAKMHFHYATVLLLVPLITAAPTSNGRRQLEDVTKTLTETVGQITGGDITKAPTGGKHLLAGAVKKVTDSIDKRDDFQSADKRQSMDAVSALALALGVVGESLGAAGKQASAGAPAKRQEDPTAAVSALTDVLGTLTGHLGKGAATTKRQEDPAAAVSALTAVLGTLTGHLGKGGAPAKRQLDAATAVTAVLGTLTGHLDEAGAPAKRQEDPASAASAFSSALAILADALSGKIPDEKKVPGGLKAPTDASSPTKREGKDTDVASVAKSVVDQVIAAVAKSGKGV